MVDLSLDSVNSQSIWGSIRSTVLGAVVPGALLTGVTGFISSRYGDSVPAAIRPMTDMLANLWNRLLNFARGFVAKEELEADQGLRNQVDRNAAFTQAAEALGGTAAERQTLATDLMGIVHRRIARDTGWSMSVDGGYAITAANELRTSLTTRLVEAYKTRNPNWTPADIQTFTPRAEAMAGAIAGTNGESAENINTNNANEGYLGALLQAQRAVAAEGNMTAAEVRPLNIPQNVAELARNAAPANVTPATEGGNATNGNNRGNGGPQTGL